MVSRRNVSRVWPAVGVQASPPPELQRWACRGPVACAFAHQRPSLPARLGPAAAQAASPAPQRCRLPEFWAASAAAGASFYRQRRRSAPAMHRGCLTRGEPTPEGAAAGVSPYWTELVKLAGPGSMSGLLVLFF